MMPRAVTASLLGLIIYPHLLLAQGTRLWVQSRYDEFEKGQPDSTSIASPGYLQTGPTLKPVILTPSTYIWDVSSDRQGNAYLATGSPATVLKVTPAGESTKLFASKDLTVQAIKVGPDGSVYAATLPSGKVFRIKSGQTGLDDASATVVFDPATMAHNTAPGKPADQARYIWDLTFDAQGALYIATGGPAAIYRVDAATGKASLFFESDEQHIRCLLFEPNGNLIAGSDGGGLVYRIGKDGKGFVIYNAPKREVTALAESPDGRLYISDVGEKTRSGLPPLPVQGIAVATATITIVTPGSVQASSSNGLIPDGSEVDELSPQGAPRKLWASRDDVVYALRSTAQGLMAATGNRGRIYRIHEDGSYVDLGRATAGQVTAFADAPDGTYVATSNTGRLYKLSSQPASQATYLSDVFDSGVFSQFGRMEVNSNDNGSSGSFEMFARSGNVENPERNWSPWQKVIPNAGPAGVPAARFIQWKAVLASAATLTSVGIDYLPVNIAPVVDEIAVEPGARATQTAPQPGQPQQISINLPSAQNALSYNQDPSTAPLSAVRDRSAVTARWSAHDDNGDELIFDVYVRGDGEKNWRLLRPRVSERFYSFDSIRLPDGGYRIRVVASDAPAHTLGDGLTGERESDHFIIDTTPPLVSALQGSLQGGMVHASFVAADAISPIARAEYSLDSGRWQFLDPVGKLSDSLTEHYEFTIPLKGTGEKTLPEDEPAAARLPATDPQEHTLTVRVYDRYENVSAAKTVIRLSPMRFELFVAMRYLRAKRRQAVVGVITVISIAGVAAGVASLIIALAITNGMRRDLQDRLLGSTAHVQLMRVASDGIRSWRELNARMEQLPHVKAAAPGLYEQVLISHGARSGGALIEGIVPQQERRVSDLLASVTMGSVAPLEPATPTDNHAAPPIVIGYDLADTIDARVGTTVLVTSPQGELTPLGLIPKFQRFQVVGIFHSGFYQYDSSMAFTSLADAQRLFGEPDVVSVISFKVDDLYHADQIGRAIEQAAGPGFLTTNWMEQNRPLFRALRLEQIVTFIVIGLIVCVAALNILTALTMMVMEKTRDIAVMMSFGVQPRQVRLIFLLQGLLIGFTGTVLGLIGGYGLSWVGGHYRFIHLSAEVYSIDYLPFAARWTDGLIVAGVSLAVSLLATLYPSSSAARILPAEALRYE